MTCGKDCEGCACKGSLASALLNQYDGCALGEQIAAALAEVRTKEGERLAVLLELELHHRGNGAEAAEIVRIARGKVPDICALCKNTRAWHREHRPRHTFKKEE